jgi:hypothetical protein
MTADGCGIADVNLPQHSIKWREKSGLGVGLAYGLTRLLSGVRLKHPTASEIERMGSPR